MIKTFVNLFKQKDIRKKIFFTLAMLFVFRLGAGIPVPLVDTDALLAGVADNSVLGIMNLLGGGALQNFSIFAMGERKLRRNQSARSGSKPKEYWSAVRSKFG